MIEAARRRRSVAACAAAVVLTLGHAAATAQADPTNPTPVQRHVIVAGAAADKVAVVGVGRDAKLVKVHGSPFRSDLLALSVTVTPDGKTAYLGQPNGIGAYRIDPDGALTKLSDLVLGTPGGVLAVTPDGSRLFATTVAPNAGVRSFTIEPSGRLTPTGAAPAVIAGLDIPGLLAISADSRFLYVTTYLTGRLHAFRIGPNSALSPLGSVGTGLLPIAPELSPDGRRIYVPNEGTADVSGFTIGADGRLAPTPGSPYRAGIIPHGVAFSADGRHAYVPNVVTRDINGYNVTDDGALVPMPGSPFPAPPGGSTFGQLHVVDERHLLAVDLAPLNAEINTVSIWTYAIDGAGRLSLTDRPRLTTGTTFSDGPASALTPNQGPVAAVSATGSGLTRTFSAAGSTDADGTIGKYEWDFGDGASTTTTTPTVTHTYATGSARTARVRVVDNEGCSATRTYTGRVVRCNGGPQAVAELRLG